MSIPSVLKFSSLAAAALIVAGCSNFGEGLLNTASIPEPQAPRVDPACVTLTAQIDSLRKDGVQDKIEKAAAKKYKMTPLDLAKADQLNKANADFQARCSTLQPKAQQTAAAQPATPAPAPAPTFPNSN